VDYLMQDTEEVRLLLSLMVQMVSDMRERFETGRMVEKDLCGTSKNETTVIIQPLFGG
jgi:hypothetical protein